MVIDGGGGHIARGRCKQRPAVRGKRYTDLLSGHTTKPAHAVHEDKDAGNQLSSGRNLCGWQKYVTPSPMKAVSGGSLRLAADEERGKKLGVCVWGGACILK